MEKRPLRLILASASPRRLKLLSRCGLAFDVAASCVDEDLSGVTCPVEFACCLAVVKARAVADLVSRGQEKVTESIGMPSSSPTYDLATPAASVILGADTIVVLDEHILGKPNNRDEAVEMLSLLSGRCHQVVTGCAAIRLPDNDMQTGYEVSQVYFRTLDRREIESYVATGEPDDKAGSYALQGAASAFVERIDGCYTNIIGLPMPLVIKMLRQFGIGVLGLP